MENVLSRDLSRCASVAPAINPRSRNRRARRMRKRNPFWNVFDVLPAEMVVAIVAASMGPNGAALCRGLARTCRRLSAIALPVLRESILSLELVVPGITGDDPANWYVRRIIARLSTL